MQCGGTGSPSCTPIHRQSRQSGVSHNQHHHKHPTTTTTTTTSNIIIIIINQDVSICCYCWGQHTVWGKGSPSRTPIHRQSRQSGVSHNQHHHKQHQQQQQHRHHYHHHQYVITVGASIQCGEQGVRHVLPVYIVSLANLGSAIIGVVFVTIIIIINITTISGITILPPSSISSYYHHGHYQYHRIASIVCISLFTPSPPYHLITHHRWDHPIFRCVTFLSPWPPYHPFIIIAALLQSPHYHQR